MLGKLTLAAGLVAMAAAFTPASAAPAMPQTKIDVAADAGSLVQQVQHRHHHHHHHWRHRHHHHHHYHRYRGGYVVSYCATWRHECAARWGWGTRGFYRCLWRHGC
jgi:hypothetical protein